MKQMLPFIGILIGFILSSCQNDGNSKIRIVITNQSNTLELTLPDNAAKRIADEIRYNNQRCAELRKRRILINSNLTWENGYVISVNGMPNQSSVLYSELPYCIVSPGIYLENNQIKQARIFNFKDLLSNCDLHILQKYGVWNTHNGSL